jgi:hypothetical protein
MELCSKGNLYELIHDASFDMPWNFTVKAALDLANGIQFMQSMKN